MFKKMRSIITGALLTSGLLCSAGLVSAQGYLRTFTLANRSSFTIRYLYVSPTSDNHWGYDQLGSYVLAHDYKVTIRLYPGYYDLKLVDEDGDTCVVSDVDFTHSDWLELNNTNLLACELLH